MDCREVTPSRVLFSETITGTDLKAANTFEKPTLVVPRALEVPRAGRDHDVQAARALVQRRPARDFLRSLSCPRAASSCRAPLPRGLALVAPRTARAADSRIDVLVGEPIGTISPNIYGHFVEHLGGVVYDGIWVGEGSKVPNVGGVRRALVEHMRRIKPGVVRWPGGCFADMYNWRDGIGPRDKRPRRTNFWRDDRGNRSSEAYRKLDSGPQKYEPNWFGTNEFMRFCRQAGRSPTSRPTCAACPPRTSRSGWNTATLPRARPRWPTCARPRATAIPTACEFWGVGNESWGCGGRLTPEEYSQEFRRFIAYVPRYGVDLKFIAAGPNGGDISWTRRFFTNMVEKGFNQLNSLWGWGASLLRGHDGQGRRAGVHDGRVVRADRAAQTASAR